MIDDMRKLEQYMRSIFTANNIWTFGRISEETKLAS